MLSIRIAKSASFWQLTAAKMKHALIAVGLGCCVLGLGCKRQPTETAAPSKPPAAKKTLLRHHFVGTAQFATSADGTQFKKIWAMPETAPFRDALAARLAEATGQSLAKRIPVLGTNASAFFRPLLDDLLQAESFSEVRQTGPDVREFDLAIELGDDRAAIWSTNLWQVAAHWNGVPPVESNGNGFAGWESKKNIGADSVRFRRARQWVVVTVGRDQAPTNLLQKIIAQGRPIARAKQYWLDADVDCAQLQSWFPNARFSALLGDLQIENFPVAHFAVSPRDEYLITQARLEYTQPIPWRPESWQVPTNLIQNPDDSLINFTAARGLTRLLRDSKIFDRFGWSPRPSQLFVWAYGLTPLHTFAAVPAADATNLLAQMAPRLEAFVRSNVADKVMGDVTWNSNRTSVTSGQMLFLQPTFSAVHVPEGDFLYCNLFPLSPVTNAPPPAELMASLARTNLIYYDWEITQHRLLQWRAMASLTDLLRIERTILPNTPSQNWLTMVMTNVGNTVTDVSLISPKEVEILRSAHVGLTGFELVALQRWIDANNFAPPDPESPAAQAKTASNAPGTP